MPGISLKVLKKQVALSGLQQLKGKLDDEAAAWLAKLENGKEEDYKNIIPYSEGDEIEDVFGEDEIPVGPSGFKGLTDFCRCVAHNKNDPRIIKVEKALDSGDPESAGAIIPIEYSNQIIKLSIEKGKIFPLCRMTKMAHAEEKIPTALSLDESAGKLYGGIEFLWVDEAGTKTEKDFKLQRIGLRANTAAALCRASNQLLDDSSPKCEAVLRSLFSDAYKNFLDNAVINGSGAGQGLGILASSCLYTQAKEAGQAASTIVFRNVTKMMERMYPDGKDNCVWLIGDDCLDQIWNLNIPVGTGGSSVMVASGAGQDIKPRPQTLLSRPIIWHSHGSALGSKGDILLCDLKQMLIGIRKQLRIDVSIHVYFTTNQTLFRIESRLDFQPIWPSTMRTRTNFETAPFVTLAART